MTGLWQSISSAAPDLIRTMARHEVQTTIFILVLLAADGLLKGPSPRFRYALWLVPLAKALWPPFLTLPALDFASRQPVVTETLAPLAPIFQAPVFQAPVIEAPVMQIPVSVAPLTEASAPALTWGAAFLGAWLVLALVVVTLMIVNFVRFRLRLRPPHAEPYSYDEPQSATGRPWPPIWATDRIHSPLTVGLLRPRIYLTWKVIASGPRALRAILYHELAHILRRDGWITILQAAALVIHPFNPLVWLMNARLSRYREQLCDDFALRRTGVTPRDYGNLLLDQLSQAKLPFLAAHTPTYFFETKRDLVHRLTELAKRKGGIMKSITSPQKIILMGLMFGLLLIISQCVGERSAENPAETINFNHDITLIDDMMAQIDASDKMGLLYFTTATCAPCKILQREVFTDDSVRAFVEANFIPYWVNSDSASGRDLHDQFDIHAVPTVVMINADGTVIDRVVGQTPADDYLQRLRAGLSGNLMDLRQQYEAYPGNNEIALEYAIELTDKRSFDSALPIYEALKDKFGDVYSNGLVYYTLANCYQHTNQSNLAMVIYEEGIKQDLFTDKRNLALANLVRFEFDRNDFSAAIEYANEIVDDEILEDPSPSQQREAGMAYIETNRARRLATLAYYKLNDPVQGKNLLDQLCQKMGDEDSWFWIAEFGQDCLIHDVANADILPWTKKAVETYQVKEDDYTLGSYGGNLARLGRYDEAIEIYQRKLAAHDKQLADHGVLMKDLMPERYKRYVLRTSANIVVLNYVAGHRDAGQALFDEILTDNAEYNVYESLIISVVSNAPQLPEAFPWVEKALALSEQESPQLLRYYAELLFKNGKVREAVEVATRVCELSDREYYRQDLEEYKAAL